MALTQGAAWNSALWVAPAITRRHDRACAGACPRKGHVLHHYRGSHEFRARRGALSGAARGWRDAWQTNNGDLCRARRRSSSAASESDSLHCRTSWSTTSLRADSRSTSCSSVRAQLTWPPRRAKTQRAAQNAHRLNFNIILRRSDGHWQVDAAGLAVQDHAAGCATVAPQRLGTP